MNVIHRPVGYILKKDHRFHFGSEYPPILIECKLFTWTATGGSPSVKLHSLNEVMLVFSVSPTRYWRILFLLKHIRKVVSLASHYIKRFGHLIGPGVEIWEMDLETKRAEFMSEQK